MRYLSGDPANHDHEVDEARWFDMTQSSQDPQVRERESDLVDMALEFLAANPAAFGDVPIVARTAEQKSS